MDLCVELSVAAVHGRVRPVLDLHIQPSIQLSDNAP